MMFKGACLGLLGATLQTLLLAPSASAEDWPSRPIHWIVPVSAGGATDISARIIQESVSRILGQPIIIDNKPGGQGVIATDIAVKSPPDGYTLALIYTSHASNPSMLPSLPYDSLRDITPVAFLWRAPLAISVHPSQPYKTFEDLVTAAKKAPGEIPIGSGGVGTGGYFASELIQYEAGIKLQHIPYRGGAPALVEFMGGQLPVLASNASVPGSQVEPDEMRPLIVSGKDRSPLLPNVPTVFELGYPEAEYYEWIAFAGPAGIPPEAVEKMNAAITQAIKEPENAKKFAEMGLEHVAMSPEELKQFIVDQTDKISDLVKKANIQVQ